MVLEECTDSGRVADKVAVITGAASGLGLETARQMALEGIRLILVDWASRELEEAVGSVADVGGDAIGVVGDASVAATASETLAAAINSFGGVDILFNNAGIGMASAGSVEETDEAAWDSVLRINTRSAFLFSKALIPYMIARGGGAIINTASVAGIRASPSEAAYSASKAAILGLTQSLALDYAPDGIRVNAICPGILEQVMSYRRPSISQDDLDRRHVWVKRAVPMGREGRYEEIARVVVFLAGPGASYITGVAIPVDGGYLLT